MIGAGSKGEELARCSWEALGTSVTLLVTDPGAVALARENVERELAAIDGACSRFRADSELSRVNAGRGRAVDVGPLLIEALELAVGAARLTDGDVDPTVGRALRLAGYDRDWSELPAPRDGAPGLAATPARHDERPRVIARPCAGWRAVTIDRASGTVRIPAGVALDLGATAKAWASDRAAHAAAQAAGCGALVSVGGDVATAGTSPPQGWLIRVTDDHRSDISAPGQTITISSGGLATSSTVTRRWSHDGQTMHHIIDPSTGRPADAAWRTVSVAADSCADANIAATATLVRPARGPAWLAKLGLPARLVQPSGRALCVGGWPTTAPAGERVGLS